MGYRVEYEDLSGRTGKKHRTLGRGWMTAVCFLLFLLLVGMCWPRGRNVLREVLIPGDAAVTVSALEELAAELKTGEPLEDALEGFCRRVLEAESVGAG